MSAQRHTWLLGFACALTIVLGSTWALSSANPFGDDNSGHFSAIMHIAAVLEAGETNLWWHQSNLGVPLFAAYQPLPTMTMGALVFVCDGWVSAVVLFKLSILLIWAIMPITWYKGARWYGLPPLFCGFLGLLTLSIQDPYNLGFGIRSATYKGLYTQHFGLLFLPLFVGLFRRYVDDEDRSPLPVACLFAVTTMSHLWVGLYATIIAVTLLVVRAQRIRLRKLLGFGLLSFSLMAWWIIPLLLTNEYAGGLPWLHETHNGWPWRKTTERFFSGDVFDFQRLPIVSVLIMIGSIGLSRYWKTSTVGHWGLLTLVTIFLFLGRTNLGELYNLLPLHSQVNVMRYMTGIHICGLVAAAAVLWKVCQWLSEQNGKIGLVFTNALALAVVVFCATDIRSTLRTFDPSRTHFSQLVKYLSSQPDHRLAVHGKLRTGSHFHRDLLPLLTQRGQLQSYALGYHCTLSTFYAEYFDFSPTACDLYDVGSIVARRPVPDSFPEDAYARVWNGDQYVVFHPKKSHQKGLFSLVQVQGAILGPSFRSIRPAVRQLTVPSYAAGVLPEIIVDSQRSEVAIQDVGGNIVDWDGKKAEYFLASITTGKTEMITGEFSDYHRGLSTYSVNVKTENSDSPAWLLLKTNMFPWWAAQINGIAVPIKHVAPNFMAVKLPPGRNQVVFSFHNPWWQKFGLVWCLLMFFYACVRWAHSTFQQIRKAAR